MEAEQRELVNRVILLLQTDLEPVERIVELSLIRLKDFKVEITMEEAHELAFAVGRTIKHIKNMTNQRKIPEGLIYYATDRICGEILRYRKATGLLDSQIQEQIVESVKVGDTQTTFAVNSKNMTFDDFVQLLIDGERSDLLSYRKLKW